MVPEWSSDGIQPWGTITRSSSAHTISGRPQEVIDLRRSPNMRAPLNLEIKFCKIIDVNSYRPARWGKEVANATWLTSVNLTFIANDNTSH